MAPAAAAREEPADIEALCRRGGGLALGGRSRGGLGIAADVPARLHGSWLRTCLAMGRRDHGGHGYCRDDPVGQGSANTLMTPESFGICANVPPKNVP
jgi:hypothetical protein